MIKVVMRKFGVGLVIGRFQPFHKGHEYLFSEALKVCDKIIIGIGSSNKKSKTNPWSTRERRTFLKEFLRQNKLEDRVVKIINLNDNPDDDVWFENLHRKTGHFDVTIGNNDWNNGIIERHGIPAVKVGFANREEWEGIKIRGLMRDKKPWRKRVPTYLVRHIKDSI